MFSNFLRFIHFADSPSIFDNGTDVKEICKVLCKELLKLEVLFRVNKLSFNITKNIFMMFYNLKCEMI